MSFEERKVFLFLFFFFREFFFQRFFFTALFLHRFLLLALIYPPFRIQKSNHHQRNTP